MKTLFNQIDSLCKTATLPGVWSTLGLHVTEHRNFIVVFFQPIEKLSKAYVLPTATDPLWRRKWRAFLTDHADEIAALAKTPAATSAATRDGQPGQAS